MTVLTNALVTRIVFDGKRAVGAEFLRDGQSHRIAARCEIVLSLNAFNTPNVLMQSGIGDESELARADIDVVQHLPGVGRNFQDHIVVGCVWEYKTPLLPRNNSGKATFFWKSDVSLGTPDLQPFQAQLPLHSRDRPFFAAGDDLDWTEQTAVAALTDTSGRAAMLGWQLGLLLATQEAAKLFGDAGGSVINIGSVASDLNPPNSVVYTATKGAVDAVTRVLAKELGPRKIRVNSINPGAVETEGTHAAGVIGSDLEKQYVARTPLGRTGQPDDIAPVAVFLASDESRWVTGDTLAVSGGIG